MNWLKGDKISDYSLPNIGGLPWHIIYCDIAKDSITSRVDDKISSEISPLAGLLILKRGHGPGFKL